MSADSRSPENHEELKASVLLGEVTLDDARVLALPDEDRDELIALLAVCTALDEEVRATPISAADEDVARQFIDSQSRTESTAAPAPSTPAVTALPSRWIGSLALAAGLAMLAWNFFGDRAPEGGGSGRLQGDDEVTITARAPVGEVGEYGEFRWDGDCPERSNFQVVVEITDADGAVREVRSDRLSLNSWTPRETFPDRIRWRVDILRYETQERREGEWIDASIRP